ncbi:response regulator [Anaerobacillus arseniciselenatis]|uniref:Response regulator n=1 Tax=Anaerobacillus arseniciselenatis TaxID=85682 RepID=A0A1S2LP26_9BACI|nr:response regulator [Anaerobacillus arseniciselenatis]OIJ13863.1 response regulator [Anaerobacillus arseniciselenatis]
MKSKLYNVFIIEDDFRVANINKQFVEKVEGFQVIGSASTGKEAIDFLVETNVLPDLILLDIYIPDVEGLELMWSIRKKYQNIDIIMLTAAKEVQTIEEVLRGGILDYIIKPIDFNRLEQTLQRFVEKQEIFETKQELTQEELDNVRVVSTSVIEKDDKASKLPKGIDRLTLEKVISILQESDKEGFTAIEVGNEIGASRSTARRYLEYLVAAEQVKAELIYGDVGRPERRYVII